MARTSTLAVSESGFVGQVVSIQPSRIRRFSNQPRKYFNKSRLEGLAKSIKRVGQKKPIKVMPITGDPEHDYELVDGERRWIACGMIGIAVLAWIVEEKDKEDQYFESVVDNMGSEPHNDLEYAYAIQEIMSSKKMAHLNIGERVEVIAESLNMSESTIERYRALLRLDPEVQALMSMEVDESIRLNGSIAHFISGLHPEVQKQIASTVVEKKMTLNQARHLARQIAENTGQVVGSKDSHEPRRDFRIASNFTKRMKNDLGLLLTPIVLNSLRRRGSKDMAVIATDIEFCIAELEKLKQEVLAPVVPQGPRPLPPASVPTGATSVAAAAGPKAVPPATAPESPSGPKATSEEAFKLYSGIFLTLFYSGTMDVKVNLSRATLAKAFPKVTDVEWATKEAIGSAKKYWRQPVPSGVGPEEVKFYRKVNKFRHDFGDTRDIDGCLRKAMQMDNSKDPVSI